MVTRKKKWKDREPNSCIHGLSEEELKKIEEAYMLDCTDEEAAIYSGCFLSNLREYLHAHPEFNERKKILRNNPFLVARKTMMQGLQSDHDFALRYMERRAGSGLSLKHDIQLSGNPDRPVEVKVKFENMSDDELDRYLDQTKKG